MNHFARPPTKAQKRVLVFARRFVKEHGFSPTLREIADGLGLSGTITVAEHLVRLQQKGFVKWDRRPRTIVVTEEGKQA